jgi:hypothetical protein
MPDSHAAWDRVGVDNEIRTESTLCEGHIFLVGDKPYDSFLTVPGCELVSDFGDTKVTGSYLDEPGTVLSFSNDHSVDNTVLVAAHCDRSIATFLNGNEFS